MTNILPNDVYFKIFEFCDLPDLANSRISHGMSIIVNRSAIWKGIAQRINGNFDSVEGAKAFILDLRERVMSIPIGNIRACNTDSVLKQAPTIDRVKQLQTYFKARDTLVVWDVLLQELGLTSIWTHAPKTLEDLIEQATHFPKWFSENKFKLSHLKKLTIHSGHLTSIPSEICELTNLEELNLCHNQLTALPSEFGNLKNLKKLYLTKNLFTSFPMEICQISQLELFTCADNQISSIPSEICNLKQMKWLTFCGNKLQAVPGEIFELGQLQSLGLKMNQLQNFPFDKISQCLPNLTTLELYRNEKLKNRPKKIGNCYIN
ncbi:MAG: E3 ubiquitin-protein ligase SlrP [Chlamydiae bacterium]|nr:E3 ubiquitin-protein ligase SlrP [Chlamydiota bacterium]